MSLVELTEDLVKSIVENPDSVSVKEFESESENEILIQVLVEEKDMGRVIGKGGKLANAIRTLVQASSYIKENKKVKINIDSF
ncbi:MAG: KH domain-containing protein [Bacilli bacterium]|nr:KH domain-containing protein [Bacilli bacterium]